MERTESMSQVVNTWLCDIKIIRIMFNELTVLSIYDFYV